VGVKSARETGETLENLACPDGRGLNEAPAVDGWRGLASNRQWTITSST
jgi:hypothetical protein